MTGRFLHFHKVGDMEYDSPSATNYELQHGQICTPHVEGDVGQNDQFYVECGFPMLETCIECYVTVPNIVH